MKLFLKVLFVSTLGFTSLAQALPQTETKLAEYVRQNLRLLGKNAQVGIAVIDVEQGRKVFSYNAEQSLIPASVLKIITTVAALKILGAEYCFPTEIYFERTERGKRNLYIRGHGAPDLVEEDLHSIAEKIRAQGVESIEHLVVDDSLFVDQSRPSGPRAYQAGSSALSLNHNSYAATVYPSRAGSKASVSLTPGLGFELAQNVLTVAGAGNKISLVETPLPSMQDALPGEKGFVSLERPRRRVTVTGKIGEDSSPQIYYRTVPKGSAYFASVFRVMLGEAGVTVKGGVYRGVTPVSATPLLTYRSRELSLIIRDVNHFSNNFMAEQLVYALGDTDQGRYDREVGLELMTAFAKNIMGGPRFALLDGNGLSRENRLTASQLAGMLNFAYRDFSIAPDFIASLSRFGHSGTLKKRKLLPKGRRSGDDQINGDSIWAKTGTLNGVSSLAGYVETKTGVRAAFSILINGEQSLGAAKKFQSGFLSALLSAN